MSRLTLAMVVAFIALAVVVITIDKTQPASTEGQTAYVVDLKDTDVQRIEIQTPSGTAAFERAEPLGWKFANSGSEADLSRVSSVVNRLAKLRSSAKVEKPGDLSTYGLSPATETATLTLKDGSTTRILIGSKTPNDAAYYAMAEGSPQLHTINTLLVGDIEKLVTQPPVPSPPAEATPSSTPRGAGTPVLETGEEGGGTPTPTVGLPAPSSGAQ
jgi:hypothetical protein